MSIYYTHKNLEVFIDVAKDLKHKNLPVSIVLTIDADQHKGAADLLKTIEQEGLNDTITNVGSVSMHDVPALYDQTDGLILPTLLESFSGTYIEAMYYEKPILTSNLDFAVGVCGGAAYYFDPLDPESIVVSICDLLGDRVRREAHVAAGRTIVSTAQTWNDSSRTLLKIIDNAFSDDGYCENGQTNDAHTEAHYVKD